MPALKGMCCYRRGWPLPRLLLLPLILFMLRPAAAAAAPGAGAAPYPVENSVVKIFASARYPDPFRPWAKQAPVDLTGSGVILDGHRILTNAHVVMYAGDIRVMANQGGDKIAATVEAISPDVDLAVLKLDNETFFDTHHPLPMAASLPGIKDAVMVYGFPQGGDNLSITKGIVSRIDYAACGYNSYIPGLRVQIDAAINPGNSGGPAVVDNKMIGIAFSRLKEADNIGYIIPCEEILLFLADVADGRYDGKAILGDELQTLENPALRSMLGLDSGAQGIVVHKPFRTDGDYPLKTWDVITKVGDAAVDDQGMIRLNHNLRVDFRYLIQKDAADGTVPLTVIRGGKEIGVKLPVLRNYPLLIPPLDGAYPSYFVYGPLVFSNSTLEVLMSMLNWQNAPRMLLGMAASGSELIRRISERPPARDERLVLVSSPFFPHRLAQGYSNPMLRTVKAVNGVTIKNLAQLVQVLRDAKDPFITVDFNERRAETVVFNRSEVAAATDDILTDNGIRNQGSPDMLAVWNKQPQ